MLHATAAAQLLHGTYFLAAISKDYVIVAIDSRESSIGAAGRITNDRYCKIRPLSSRAIFFATGTASATGSKTRATIFDAREIAQQAFDDFTGDNFEDLANKWATQMKAVYLSYVDSFPFMPNNEIVAEGFFVGINSHDESRRLTLRSLDAQTSSQVLHSVVSA
jgi:hypothetical protein